MRGPAEELEEAPMPAEIVQIRREWNDRRRASVPFDKLERPHWSWGSGGVFAPAPQPFIHGYVWCTDVDGDLAHSCTHGPPPHRIKVCVVKKGQEKPVWEKLLAAAGPKPQKQKAANVRADASGQ